MGNYTKGDRWLFLMKCYPRSLENATERH